MRSIIVLVLSLACTACAKWSFLSNCCEPHDDERLGRICDDGSRAPLVGCCGVGSCNVMCCNCDGGCKSGDHRPYKFLGVWGADISPNVGLTSGTSDVVASVKLGRQIAGKALWETGKAVGSTGLAYNSNKKEVNEENNLQYIPDGWGR